MDDEEDKESKEGDGCYKPTIDFAEGSLIELTTDLPKEMKIYETFFDINIRAWQSWKQVFYHFQGKAKSVGGTKGFSSIIVTQDFVRMQFLMQRLFHGK